MRRDSDDWVEEERLSGYSPAFGQNIAADGDTLAALGGADGLLGGGTVFIFHREGATWVLTDQVSEEPIIFSPFGVVMALRDDVLAVGQHRTATDPLPEDPHGRVYVYRRSGARWEREAIINEDGARGDWYFAQDITFVGEWLAIESSGVVQLYAPNAGAWEFVDSLRTPLTHGLSTVAGDRRRPARLVAGEPDTGFRATGAAHVFSLAACYCRPDLTGDGQLDLFDFLAFQNLFAAGDLRADFDGSGELDFFDFLAFQDAFAAGC
ncbi:MAG: GC-type dockerin domain-anchored protein [Phycisphaerales bacterium JB039]